MNILASILLMMATSIFAQIESSDPVPEISDWTNPTIEDYQRLQDYLHHAKRPELALSHEYFLDGTVNHKRRENQQRKYKLLNGDETTPPKLECRVFNTTPEDKECCVVTYTNFNSPYPQFLEQMIDALEKQGFNGHFLFQKGGCPYLSGGGLKLFNTPFAFKICMLQEARRLGYRYVLWLDVACIPQTDLRQIFNLIKKKKGVFLSDPLQFDFWAYQYILKVDTTIISSIGATADEMNQCLHLNGRMVGLDLIEPRNLDFLDAYFEMAFRKIPFCASCMEQIVLTYLAHKYKVIKHVFNGERFSKLFDVQGRP